MDTIFIEQLKVKAIVGVYPQERLNKQLLFLDIEMSYDTKSAARSDKLSDALDYHKITKEIHAFVSSSSYQLIETLAEAIAKKLLIYKQVKKVKVTLSKPKALDQAKNVGIRISRSNEG